MTRRGAPKGNTNALKHGFYSESFRRGETADLETRLSAGLLDEIAMLRVYLRRVFEKASGAEPDLTLEQMRTNLYALGMASIQLSTLVRTHSILHGEDAEIASSIHASIREAMKGFKLTR